MPQFIPIYFLDLTPHKFSPSALSLSKKSDPTQDWRNHNKLSTLRPSLFFDPLWECTPLTVRMTQPPTRKEMNFKMNPPWACPSPFPQKSISYNSEKLHKESKCQAAQAILRALQGKDQLEDWADAKTLSNNKCQNKRPKFKCTKNYHRTRNWNTLFLVCSFQVECLNQLWNPSGSF